MVNFGLCFLIYSSTHPFLNLYAGNAESVKEINVLESSSEPVGISALKEEQNYDESEVPDSARCSKCLKQVPSLSALYIFYINQYIGDRGVFCQTYCQNKDSLRFV